MFANGVCGGPGSYSSRQIGQTLASEINGKILNCFSGTLVSLTKFRESGGV